MRRLDEALLALAEQDAALEIDDLLAGLERRLSGDGDAVVVALPGRPTMETLERTRTTERPRRWRPVAVVVAAAVVLLLAIGLPVLLLGGEDSVVDDPTTTVATTAAPTPTAVPDTTVPEAAPPPSTTVASTTAAPAPPAIQWTELGLLPAFAGFAYSQVSALIEGGPGLIAVGQVVEGVVPEDWSEMTLPPGLHWDAAVWVSEDGLAWEQVVDPAFEGLDPAETGGLSPDDRAYRNQMMMEAAAGPHGVVAVGNDGHDGVAWFSPDGRTWTEVILPEAIFYSVNAVTAGGPGWVAVGNDGAGNGAVWVTADGLEWTAVAHESLMAAEGSRVELADVVASGSGVAAIGYTGFEDSGVTSAVWTSADGVDWGLAAHGALGDVLLFEIAYDPASDRLLTFAPPPRWPPNYVMWASEDGGLTWTPGESAAPDNEGTIALDGERLVGFGKNYGTWVSGDGGMTWERTLDEGPVFGAMAPDGRVIGISWWGDIWVGEWLD